MLFQVSARSSTFEEVKQKKDEENEASKKALQEKLATSAPIQTRMQRNVCIPGNCGSNFLTLVF